MSDQILLNGQPHQFINGQLQAAELLSGKAVTITPAIVEIAVMKVGNKQVTQSLFKQLPQRSFLNYSGEIDGNIWGWVKYKFDNFTNEDGIHLLFQNGNILYRDWIVKSQIMTASLKYDEKVFECFIGAIESGILDIGAFKDGFFDIGYRPYTFNDQLIKIAKIKGSKTGLLRNIILEHQRIKVQMTREGYTRYQTIEYKCKTDTDFLFSWWSRIDFKVDQLSKSCLGLSYLRDAETLIKELEKLPQLFIAV